MQAAVLPQVFNADKVETPAVPAPRRVLSKFWPCNMAITEESEEEEYSDDDGEA